MTSNCCNVKQFNLESYFQKYVLSWLWLYAASAAFPTNKLTIFLWNVSPSENDNLFPMEHFLNRCHIL